MGGGYIFLQKLFLIVLFLTLHHFSFCSFNFFYEFFFLLFIALCRRLNFINVIFFRVCHKDLVDIIFKIENQSC